jgi:hypothetical protein
MMTGALVLPEVIVGMIEASTMRKPGHSDAAGNLRAGEEGPPIQFVGEIIGPYGRRCGRIGRLGVDGAVDSGRHWYSVTRHARRAIKGSDLWVGVARMREEKLNVRHLEFRARLHKAVYESSG